MARNLAQAMNTVVKGIGSDPRRLSLALGMLVAGLAIIKYGVSMSPGWENLFLIAQNWQQPGELGALQPPQDYILSNGALSLALGVAGITQQNLYVTFQVGLAIVAIVLPFLMPSSLRSPAQSRLLFLMLAGGPISAVLITWIGGYDALGVIGASVAVLARGRLVSALGWVVFSLAHGALAGIALVLVVTYAIASRPDTKLRATVSKWWLPSAAVLVGWLGTLGLTSAWGGATSRLEVYLLYPFDYYVNSFISGMPYYIFSILGVGWVIALSPGIRGLRSTKSLIVITLVAGSLLPLVALDQTRVTALALLPTVLLWVRSLSAESIDVTSLWHRYAIAAAIVPVPVVWEGSIVGIGWERLLAWRASFL